MDSLSLYHQAHTSAVAFDLSHFGKLVLTGADRATFLQNFTTNDVMKPGVGSGCETFLTTAQAKIVAWLRIAIRADDIYLTMEPGADSKVLAHLQRYLIAEDVQLDDRIQSDLLWHLCGPEVFSRWVPRFAGTPASRAYQADIASGVPQAMAPISAWQPWQNAAFKIDQLEFCLQRCDFLGLPGCFLIAQRELAPQLESILQGHALPLIPGDDPVWNMLRLEAGTPAFGIDFDETNLPQEVNRTEQAISFTKGCYIGQETVARIRAYGHVNRLLIGIKLVTSSADPMDGSKWSGGKLFHQEKEAGALKSVAYSPRLESLLAFALVRREYSAAGTKLVARTTTRETEAEVVAFPVGR
jgi:folate-binding protein YgfZ